MKFMMAVVCAVFRAGWRLLACCSACSTFLLLRLECVLLPVLALLAAGENYSLSEFGPTFDVHM